MLRRFLELIGRKNSDKGTKGDNKLASPESAARQFSPMANVAPAPGEVIGDYEILERIGGNMALVYKARHRLLNKVRVLKLVPADCMADAARLARFDREMRVLGQLEHPNLVTAVDARTVGEWHLVAMELIDGVDLQRLVKDNGPLSVADGCEVARQAALGLDYAHQHGLIHRDIKPSNLMLTRAGVVKVIDMGLALTRDDSTGHLTQTGLVLGTMSYCAPEQFRDASHVDIRADIYSLGCTLYHLIVGKSPYWQRKTFAEIVQAHLHEPFPNLTEARPDAPTELEAVLTRMTAKDPNGRFSTPREVVDALEPFARGAELTPLVPVKTEQDPPHRAGSSKPSPTPFPQPAASQSQSPSARWPRIAALLALLLGAGALFLVIFRHAPVVVFIDTTSPRGIYDRDNMLTGRSNAKELYDLFQREIKEIPPENIDEQSVGLNWKRKSKVRSLRSDLVVIHRSVFYHPAAAALGFPYPDEFNTHEEYEQFKLRYEILGDHPLREFLDDIGTAEPRTKFLIYSRGTDTNWLSDEYRLTWTKEVEDQYPALKGRIATMLIEAEKNGTNVINGGTFRNPRNRDALLKRVREILRLPKKEE